MADEHLVTGLSNDPWYSRLARTVLDTSGPTAVVALALVGFLAWAVWGQLTVVQAKLDAIHGEIITAKASMSSFAVTQNQWNTKREDLLEQQLRLMRAICVNSAKSDAALKGCLE